MARCCEQVGSCSCRIQVGSGLTIEGVGSAGDPFLISMDASGGVVPDSALAERLLNGPLTDESLADAVEGLTDHGAFRTALLALIGTISGLTGEDGAVAALINNPNSLVAQALADTAPGEVSYADNRTGTPTTIPGTAPVPIPHCVAVVPPSTAPLWVEWGCTFGLSGGGGGVSQGQLMSSVYEITYAPAVIPVDAFTTYVQTSMPPSAQAAVHRSRTRVEPADTPRMFALYGSVVREGGTETLSAYVRNLVTKFGSSFITVVSR